MNVSKKIANLRVLERRAGPKAGTSFCCILLFSAEISSLFACIENSMEKKPCWPWYMCSKYKYLDALLLTSEGR
jgi:hypothetical protein